MGTWLAWGGLLEDVKRAAEADDRSVSAWIRRAVEHELH